MVKNVLDKIEDTLDKKPINKSDIESSYNDRNSKLEIQIQNVELRQQELYGQITTIDQQIILYENQITYELQKQPVNYKAVNSLTQNAVRLRELLSTMYRVYKEFEDVKYRYHKSIDDIINNKYKLLAVEIRKIEEKIDDHSDTNLMEIMSYLTKSFSQVSEKNVESKVVNQAQQSLKSDPEYDMD